ncbi:MAG TPA: cytochrome c, partial [Polyangiaceae bacterium]|nr:cytochrome c [Polyangiaceae bacterium]
MRLCWTSSRAAILGLSLFAIACKSEAHDLREWKPSDHDHTSEPGRDQVDVSDPASNPLSAHGISEVVLLGWRQNCVRCHGVIGRGDGSQAAATRPPDLTDPERQAQLTDADIKTVIRQGRGLMPAHDLPDSTIDGLVKLVRLLNSSGRGMAAAAASAAPAASDQTPQPPVGAAPENDKAHGELPSTATPASSATPAQPTRSRPPPT